MFDPCIRTRYLLIRLQNNIRHEKYLKKPNPMFLYMFVYSFTFHSSSDDYANAVMFILTST